MQSVRIFCGVPLVFSFYDVLCSNKDLSLCFDGD